MDGDVNAFQRIVENQGGNEKQQVSQVLFVHLNSIEIYLTVCTTQKMR